MWIVGVIIAVIVVSAIYWFVIRKPEGEEALPEAQEPRRLSDRDKGEGSGKDEAPRLDKPNAADKKPSKPEPAPKKKTEDKPEPKKRDRGEEDKKKDDEASKKASKKAEEESAKKPADDGDESEPDDKQPSAKSEEPSPGEASKDESEKQQQEASDAAEQEEAETKPEDEGDKADAAEEPKAHEPSPLVAESVEPTTATRRVRDVEGLRKGLGKSRAKEGFFGRLAKLITGTKEIDPDIIDDMEEVLITSDVGVKTTEAILDRIRDGMKSKELDDSDKVWGALRSEAMRILDVGEGGLTLRAKPTVVLMVGVNGSGKTTTIGKIATQTKSEGREALLAAGDTFRAAAVQQLQVWGQRVGCEVVKGKDGADPAAVIFDAVRQAAESGADLVLADTAGRLHTKSNLMDELKKVSRTMGKALEGAPHEILLVIDATNGQNALAQSRQFAEALPLTGIVLTKLDGTAKGGMILGICDELKVPVRYIGIGEKADDLRPFQAEEFVEALLGSSDSEEIEAA